jgi:DNA-binding NarL/FixJ family response regulator
MVVLAAAPMPRTKSIVLVDSEATALYTTQASLTGYRVHATTSLRVAMRLVRSEPVDAVITELDGGGVSGLELLVAVRRAHPSVVRIALATTPSAELAMRAINEAAVHYFFTRPCDPAVLQGVIGGLLSSPRERSAPAPVEVGELTPRLRETLEVVITGASEKQIADQLGISHHTAHQYIQALFRAFGVTSRAQLMAHVLRR